MLNKFVIEYIGEILIYSYTMEEHINQVRQVLQRLIQFQLYAKAEKCELHKTSTSPLPPLHAKLQHNSCIYLSTYQHGEEGSE